MNVMVRCWCSVFLVFFVCYFFLPKQKSVFIRGAITLHFEYFNTNACMCPLRIRRGVEYGGNESKHESNIVCIYTIIKEDRIIKCGFRFIRVKHTVLFLLVKWNGNRNGKLSWKREREWERERDRKNEMKKEEEEEKTS